MSNAAAVLKDLTSWLPPIVVIANNKGGVGKTSLVANTAACIAATGKRVLCLDCDPQGNLTKQEFGLVDNDRGREQAIVMQMGGVLTPVTVRENIDVIQGGQHLRLVAPAVLTQTDGTTALVDNLVRALAPIVGNYDVVLVDTAPQEVVLIEALLQVGTYLMMPTMEDEASIDGLGVVGRMYMKAREAGSDVELLGAVMFDVNPQAKARNAATQTDIEHYVGDGGVFETRIPTNKAAAKDARKRHVSVLDLIAETKSARKKLLAALHRGEQLATKDRTWSSKEPIALAQSYQDLSREMLVRIAGKRREAQENAAGAQATTEKEVLTTE